MALLGLSVLIASLTFLCYRHPPSTWRIASRFQRTIGAAPRAKAASSNNDAPISGTETASEGAGDGGRDDADAVRAKQEADRKEMPPPSFKLTTSTSTTSTSTNSTSTSSAPQSGAVRARAPIPTFIIADDEASAPTFPAANSAQRAAGSRPAVPTFSASTLSSPASPASSAVASSAQRASDRDAMPPPRMPSMPSISSDDEPTAPAFPALNSAQRASGGLGPPRQATVQAQPALRSIGQASSGPRGPLPNRGPGASSSSPSTFSLAPPPTHNAIPTKPRKKVQLTPGHSPLDWARLTSSPSANLRGLPADAPYLRVPPSLLRQYTGRRGKDAWTVLGGKVYNMTPYLPYHPGGEPELLKAAGRDGTRLFGEVHPWVNWEGMLEGCLIGIAVEEGEVSEGGGGSGGLEEMD